MSFRNPFAPRRPGGPSGRAALVKGWIRDCAGLGDDVTVAVSEIACRHAACGGTETLAMIDVAAENETPMIAMAASARIVEPMDDKRRWVFKTAQNDAHMATAIVEHMTNNAVKTVAYIGFSDAYG